MSDRLLLTITEAASLLGLSKQQLYQLTRERSYGPRVSVTVNMTTGQWASTNGLSGTLAGAGLTNIISQFKADRNLMETFAAGASGILPGAQVSW